MAVGAFLDRYRSEILAEWRLLARDTVAGIDDALVEKLLADLTQPRLVEQLGVTTAVKTLSLLRQCMLRVWQRCNPDGGLVELRGLDRMVDDAIEACVVRFDERFSTLALERERTLAKLESLLRGSPVGIAFLDPSYRYIRINDALAAINGIPAADHIGKTLREVLPDYADALEPLMHQVLAAGEPLVNLALTVPGARPEEPRHLLANYFPVRAVSGTILGVGGVVLDVTDTKRAQQALELERTRLESIVTHAPAAIWIKDLQGRLLVANERLADAIGHRDHDVLGKRSDELLPTSIADPHQEHDALVLRENRAIEFEESAPGPNGVRTFLSVKFPIPGDPPLIGGIATEITARKRMEEDLRDAIRMREEVLAVVSHDLRGPLGSVQLSTTLLMSHVGSDQRARRHLEVINRSCTRMEHLIDDLLDTAMIRAGRFQLVLAEEVVDDVLGEAIDLQQPIADEKGIQLVRVGNVPGLRVVMDRDRILQVFGNLVGNALKFCRAGDIISMTVDHDANEVRFSVQDTGPGIAADVIPRLFEPYWSAPEHSSQGSGLGLYIVRGIMESHGGRVWVESSERGGAQFFITLPLARPR